MSKVSQTVAVIVLSVLMLGCNSGKPSKEKSQAKAQPTTKEGFVEQASFTDLNGNTVSVSDYKGKVVLIDFWETWCRPCLATFPTLEKLQQEYPENFVVLAVTPGFSDTKEDAQSFAKNHDYSFNYLLDSTKLHEKLEVQGIPFKVYIDAEGNFIKQSMGTAGPEGDYEMIKKIIEKHKKS